MFYGGLHMAINTGIKANDKFIDILSSVIGQMSDGIWENTRSMEKYWKSLRYSVNDAGYIIIEDRHYACADPVSFFANKIKQIIKIEIDDGNKDLYWDRCCSGVPFYMHGRVTVGDCYKLYELLKGRDTDKHAYATYSTYDVTLIVDGHVVVIPVEALNERAAKTAALKKLTEQTIVTSIAVKS
jgi:hypothetical protein